MKKKELQLHSKQMKFSDFISLKKPNTKAHDSILPKEAKLTYLREQNSDCPWTGMKGSQRSS